MKKLLSLLLLLALSVTLLAGCAFLQPDATEPTDAPTAPTAPQSFLESAKTLLFNEYKPASKDEVPEKKKDFALLNNIMAGGDNHPVVWAVTVTSGDPESVKIIDNAKVDVPENSSVEILFTLTATISDPYGNNANLSFNFKVPVYVPSSLSVVDPVAGEAYKLGMVQGNLDDTLYYLSGGMAATYYLATSENEADAIDVYLEEVEGGYYLYILENGEKKYINHTISDTHVNAKYEDTASTVYTYDTERKTLVIKAQASDDTAPVDYLLGNRSTGDKTNLGFYKASENPFYVKFYGFDPNACQHTVGTAATCTSKAICAKCGEAFGVKLDHDYNPTTNLCVCGAHNPNVELTVTIPEALEQADDQKVVVSGTVSSIKEGYSADYNNISVYITDENGNTLYVYRLTGEVSVGDIITVKGTMASYNGNRQIAQGGTFEKTGHDDSYDYVEMTITDAKNSADGTNVIISGTVVEINGAWDSNYKNMTVTIADAAGNKLYVYRLATQVVLGDTITIKGSVGSYNGEKQIAQGATAEITGHDDSYDYVEMTITDAKNAEDGTNVIISGTVTEIDEEWSSYNNMSVIITDADGNSILVHRMKTKVALGDIITVTGSISTYNNEKQIGIGATAKITGHDDNIGTDDGTGSGTPDDGGETPDQGGTDDGVMSIPEVLASSEGTAVVVKGTVSEIYQSWNDQYSNISFYISDEAGNKLLVYRTGTKVSIGDKVTVTGKATVYSGTIQIAQGGTTVIDEKHVCTEFSEVTCTAPATCVVCGATSGNALEHTYVNGFCSCGAAEPTGNETTVKLAYTGSTTANMTDGNNAAIVGLDATLFTVTSIKCDQSNHVGMNKNGDIRLYADNTDPKDGNGAELTVAIATGKIKSIKIKFNSTSYAANCAVKDADGNTITKTDGSSATVEVAVNSSSFTLKNAGSAQVRIDSIEIIYG